MADIAISDRRTVTDNVNWSITVTVFEFQSKKKQHYRAGFHYTQT